jgi:alpha-tubulin suppressor-like RCC1 family protein
MRPPITSRLLGAFAALILASSAASCAFYEDVSPPTDATLAPKDVAIVVGETQQFTLVDGDGNDVDPGDVDWASRDPGIAPIDDSGTVTGEAEGSTVITAGWKKAQLNAAVNVELDSFRIEPAGATLEIDGSEQFRAVKGTDEGEITELEVEWTSDKSDVAEFSDDEPGLLQANDPGSTTIRAKRADVEVTAAVDVQETVQLLDVSPAPVAALPGESVCLTADARNVRDERITDAEVSWSVDDSNVAEVTSNSENSRTATVQLKRPESTTVTAEAGEQTASAEMTSTEWVDVASGYRFTCALSQAGRALCWGWNEYGQLGDGTTDDRESPVSVVVDHLAESEDTEPPEFTSISAGITHVCAISDAKDVYCWGRNNAFQLAIRDNDNVPQSPRPRNVGLNDENVVDIGSGRLHSCTLTESGVVECWGGNDCGQLGHSDAQGCEGEDQPLGSPIILPLANPPEDTKFEKLTTGARHNCALSADGDIYCWGWLSHGQLGNGQMNGVTPDPDGSSTTNINEPVQVDASYSTKMSSGPPTPPFRDVTAGQRHTCAIDSNEDVYCWGWNRFSQSGENCLYEGKDSNSMPKTFERCAVPSEVDFTGAATELSDAGPQTCLLDAADDGHCWGWAQTGALGIGNDQMEKASPQSLDTDATFSELSGNGVTRVENGAESGRAHTCGVTLEGGLRCWGNNLNGALGNGNSGRGNVVWSPTDIQFSDTCTNPPRD